MRESAIHRRKLIFHGKRHLASLENIHDSLIMQSCTLFLEIVYTDNQIKGAKNKMGGILPCIECLHVLFPETIYI